MELLPTIHLNPLPILVRWCARLIGGRRTTRLAQRFYPLITIAKHRRLHFFDRVAIENTTWCNRRCYYCPYGQPGATVPDNQMTHETFNLVVTRLKQIRWSECVAFGIYGEPLSDPRIVHLVMTLKASLPHCLPVIYSNGDYLTVPLAAQLVEAGLWRMGITEHPPSNDAWRAKIRAIVQRWPNHFGWQKIPPTEMVNHGGSVQSIAPKGGPCRVAGSVLAVRWDGRVTLCCNDLHSTVVIGDLHTQTIPEIHDSDSFTRLRTDLRRGVRRLPICQRCRTCE